MIKSFLSYSQKLIFTLRFSLLSIFIVIFLALTLTIFSMFYWHVKDIVGHAGSLLMDKTAYSILYNLELQLRPAESASQFSASNIRQKVLDVNNPYEVTGYMRHLLEKLPLTEAMYWSGTNGDFIYTARDKTGFTMEVLNQAQNSDIVTKINNQNKLVSQTSSAITYNPHDRPWYQLAIKGKHTVWTDVYAYIRNKGYLGTTVATPIYSDIGVLEGVFALDLRLNDFANFIRSQSISPNGMVVIVDDQGRVIASQEKNTSAVRTVNDFPVLAKAFALNKHSENALLKFKYQRINYVATFKPIPILEDNGWMIGIVAPLVDFTNALHQIELYFILIIVGLFLVGVFLMSYLVTLVVTPIKKVVDETEKLKHFELSPSLRIHSRIKEVIELSDAIYSMKTSLRSFQKYVPADIVRQLITMGEDAKVGGSKREIAVFFSDIKDFTAITEQTDTDQLVKQVYDYFETLSRLIIDTKGTIDKYIGDSIMAFWNAPMTVAHPCEQAAKAALNCVHCSQDLNTVWAKDGLPTFFTRIGLHYGEAIVGSVGSSERLNYTALGDTVNVADRLEKANKIYGTSILVSEIVYERIKDTFILRFVDEIILRGRLEKIRIYELLDEDKQSILFDIDLYQKAYYAGFSAYQNQAWNEAIKYFETCLEIYKQDTLAPIFIVRCKWLRTNPPGAEWKGVWRLDTKG